MPAPSVTKFPLRKLVLRNFKSVREAEIEISPLTIVVGANSSGKSTLLQSILSIAQATSKDAHGTNFPLNGERIRLGTFAETRCFSSSEDEPIQIGFEIESVTSDRNVGERNRDSDEQLTYKAHFRFDLRKFGTVNSGSAQVSAVEIDAERETAPGSRTASQLITMRLNFPEYNSVSSNHRGSRDCSGTLFDTISGETHRISKAEFTGLIPTNLSEKNLSAFILADLIWAGLHKELTVEIKEQKSDVELYRPTDPKKIGKAVSDTVEILVPILELMEETDGIEFSDYSLSLMSRISSMTLAKKRKLATCAAWSSIEAISAELIRSSGLPNIDGEAYRRRDDQAANSLKNIALLTQRLFKHRTTYLGPIRETPKVNYDPNTSRADVGPRGEYTAFVLNEIGGNRNRYPLADGTEQSVSLNHALNGWLQFLGLADGAKTVDNGRLGIGLSLNLISGGHEVDLTSVGVGVSQVLPVIVACLMAKPGSITLIEQPELHLHPKLQMQLADFLLACCRSGRQIIIETHSEHLVNRLRRRVAEDESGLIGNTVGILFAEQRNGITQYRSPKINQFGGLSSDWPDGFLEVGAAEAESLLEAGMLKRQKVKIS